MLNFAWLIGSFHNNSFLRFNVALKSIWAFIDKCQRNQYTRGRLPCYTLPMKKGLKTGVLFAIISALCSSINTPLSKLLLSTGSVGPILSGGTLYLGAVVVAAVVLLFQKLSKKKSNEIPIDKKDAPYVIGVGVLNGIGVACSMLGLKLISASNAALLSNFEIVVTSLVALFIFKDKISPRLWVGIVFVLAACILLSSDDISNLHFSLGALLVLVAPVCWGFGNNFMKRIAHKNPFQSILIEGLITFTLCAMLSVRSHEITSNFLSLLWVLGIGIIAFGISLCFYIYAQRIIGAPRTSAFFMLAPFIAVIISFIIFQETPGWWYFVALGLMVIGTWLASSDKPLFVKKKTKKAANN